MFFTRGGCGQSRLGLLDMEKRTEGKVWQPTPLPPQKNMYICISCKCILHNNLISRRCWYEGKKTKSKHKTRTTTTKIVEGKVKYEENHVTHHLYHHVLIPRLYASLGPSRARTGLLQLVKKANRCHLRGSTLLLPCSIFNNNFLRLVSISSVLVAKSSRVFLFPPRDHKTPLPLRDHLNPHPCPQRRHFPVPRYVKHPDVAVFAIDELFLISHPIRA